MPIGPRSVADPRGNAALGATMKTMDHSMAQPGNALTRFELPGWKSTLNWVGAIATALVLLAAGLWKITDPQGAAVRMANARVPEFLSLWTALGFGIAETFAGVLVLVPRFRRWGAWLAALLLISFLVYFAINYQALRGEECSCFPWVKRVVGPGFFIGDAVMLAFAILAGWWARPSAGRRSATLVLAAVAVFALVSYGVAAARQTGTKAPETISVNGQPYSLEHGQIFLYYFDPECPHCIDAAKRMAKLNWAGTKVVGVPIQQPQFSAEFMQETGLRAPVSSDAAKLRKVFPFVSAPAGVALRNGRQVASLTQFEGSEPEATLKKLGFVH